MKTDFVHPVGLSGIITVLNTPFTEQGDVDIDSLRRHVRIALKAGVAGILVPAMASEVEKLSDSERISIIKAVLEEVNHLIPVIAGASTFTQSDRLRHSDLAMKAGCEGLLVHIPYHDDQQYRQEVREIAALKPGFLMLQDWDFQGYGLPVALIQELFAEIEVFRCLKVEVVPAGRKYTEVLEATQGKLHVSGGWAVMQMIEALDRGAHAFMPTGMHSIYTTIYALYQQGNRDTARQLFNELLPVLAFSNQHLDISVHFFKRLLYKQGIYATPNVRKPILPFDRHHQRIADELIEHVLRLTERVTSGEFTHHMPRRQKNA